MKADNLTLKRLGFYGRQGKLCFPKANGTGTLRRGIQHLGSLRRRQVSTEVCENLAPLAVFSDVATQKGISEPAALPYLVSCIFGGVERTSNVPWSRSPLRGLAGTVTNKLMI